MPPNNNEGFEPHQPNTSPLGPQPPVPSFPNQPAGTPQVIGPALPDNQPAATPSVPTPGPLPLSKKRRWPKFLLIVLAVLLLMGSGGGYAYWNMLNNRPEKVLADALSNTMSELLDRKPTTTVGKLVFESTGDEPFKFTLDFDAKQIDENYQTTATLHFEGFDVDVSFSSDAVVMGDKNEAYIKLDKLAETVNGLVASMPEYQTTADAIMPFIQKVDGQWIKLDTQSWAEVGMTESEHQFTACSDAFKELRVRPEDKQAIKDIFARNQFAIATEKLPKQDIDGEDSFHYKLDLNEAASIRFTKELIGLKSFENFKKACEIESDTFDQQLKNLEEEEQEHKSAEHEDDPQKPVIELWVGSETRLPTKLRITWEDEELAVEFDTNVKINASDVKIEAPKEFMTLQEFQEELNALSETADPSNLLLTL